MPGGVDVQSYNVVVITQPVGDVSGLPSTVEDMARIVSNPQVVPLAPDHLRLVSPRDQLTLDFRPRQASLTDLSGQLPARSSFESGVHELVEFFALRSVPVAAYGWNIEVLLGTFEVRELLAPLLQPARIDHLLTPDPASTWRASEIEFEVDRSSETSGNGKMTLRLGEAMDSLGGVIGSYLSANWHFDRPPPPPDGEGARFAEQVERVIRRLTGPMEGEHE